MSAGYSARVSAEVAGRLDAAGIDARALGELLGCSRRWAAGLLAGRRPWSLDDLAMVADRLGVEVMALAAPGVEVQRTDDEVAAVSYLGVELYGVPVNMDGRIKP